MHYSRRVRAPRSCCTDDASDWDFWCAWDGNRRDASECAVLTASAAHKGGHPQRTTHNNAQSTFLGINWRAFCVHRIMRRQKTERRALCAHHCSSTRHSIIHAHACAFQITGWRFESKILLAHIIMQSAHHAAELRGPRRRRACLLCVFAATATSAPPPPFASLSTLHTKYQRMRMVICSCIYWAQSLAAAACTSSGPIARVNERKIIKRIENR